MGQLAHAEVIDDQQRDGRQRFHELPARAIDDCLGQLIEQYMRLAVENAIALLNGRLTDGLCQMTLAGAAGAEKQCIFPPLNESGRGQIEDQAAVHLLVKGEVEVIERLVRIAEAGLFAAPFQQSVGASCQLIRYQTSNQIDGRHRLRLCLMQPGLEDRGDASQS
jgi:hypothetical protein